MRGGLEYHCDGGFVSEGRLSVGEEGDDGEVGSRW